MQFSDDGNLTLSKAEAVALATYSSDDETRPHLAGVWIEPGMLRAWSTDGSRALMARRIGGHILGRHEPVLVPRPKLLDAARMCRGRDVLVIYLGPSLAAGDGTRTLGAGRVVGLQAVAEDGTVRGSVHCTPPEATAPPIDQVLHVPERPTRPSTPAFGMNACLFADVALLARAAGRELVDVYPGADGLSPLHVRVTADDNTEWTAAIMPARTGAPDAVDVDAAVEWAAGVVRKAHGKAASMAFQRDACAARALPAEGETTEATPIAAPKRRKGSKKAA